MLWFWCFVIYLYCIYVRTCVYVDVLNLNGRFNYHKMLIRYVFLLRKISDVMMNGNSVRARASVTIHAL